MVRAMSKSLGGPRRLGPVDRLIANRVPEGDSTL